MSDRSQRHRAGRRASRRASRLPFVLAAIVLVAALPGHGMSVRPATLARPRAAASPPHCPELVSAPGVGRACPTANGLLRVDLEDGFSFTTHGADASRVVSPFQAPLRPRPVSCSQSDTQFRVELFYAHASDTASRFSSLKAEIQRMVEGANGLVYDEGRLYSRSLSLRVLCAASKPYVRLLKLPTPKAQTSLETVIRDMRAMGYTNPLAKYWVWVDKTIKLGSTQILGTGSFVDDERLSATNANMVGAGYSAIWGHRINAGAHVTMLHEGFHNLGGVPMGAPHTTGAAHCTDGVDVMCYRDGGPLDRYYSTNKCTERVALDCRGDDYFNPVPKSSNYLYSHWNLASPYNRFLKGCAYLEGVLRAPANGQDPEAALPAEVPPQGVVARSARISTSCAGRSFAITGIVQPPPQQAHSLQGVTGNVPGTTSLIPWAALGQQEPTDFALERVVPDLDVCFYKGSRLLRCVTGAADRGTVPSGTDTVRVILVTGANVVYVFSAL